MAKKTESFTEERIKKLKQLIPEIFVEGKLDYNKLKETFGDLIETSGERYTFNWAGRSIAIRLRDQPSKATLVPARKESVAFDSTKNIFIEGENLEVLKILQKSYEGKIKMIYIDPPYNTGKDFVYKDDFKEPLKNYLKITGQLNGNNEKTTTQTETSGRKHSNWLTMMYPRLALARNLLRDDGVIFVSIDDNEIHNLRIVMNEIFGEENFITALPWKARGGRQDSEFLAEIHEYILMYSKNSEEFSAGGMIQQNGNYPKFDGVKKIHYKTQLARKWGSNSRRKDRPNLYYSIKSPDGSEIFPTLYNGEDGCWRWSPKRMKEEIDAGNIEFVKEQGWVVYEKIYEPQEGEVRTKKYSSWLDDVGTSSSGTKEAQEIFDGSSPFDHPKPTTLIKRLLSITDVYKGDIILDFFAGSGSLAHALLSYNFDNATDATFILVQLPQKVDGKIESGRVAINLNLNSISDICKERIRRVIKKLEVKAKQQKLTSMEKLDLGFKVFKLSDSSAFVWDEQQARDQETLKKFIKESAKRDLTGVEKDKLVFELMLREGFRLDLPIEKILRGKNKFFKIVDNGHSLWLCLDNKIDSESVLKLGLDKDVKLIVLDSALTDTLKANLGRKVRIETV